IWSLSETALCAFLIYPVQSLIYVGCALAGWSSAISYVIASTVISRVSAKHGSSEAKNSGLWNLSLMSSVLFCNLAVYLVFNGKSIITDTSRYSLMIPLTVVGVCGCLPVFFINEESYGCGSSKLPQRKYLNRNDESKCNNSQIDSANSSQCVEISHTHRSSNADEVIFAITAYGDGTRDNASAGNGSYWNNLKDILTVQVRLVKEMCKSCGEAKALFLYSTGPFLGIAGGFCSGVDQSAVGNSLYIKNSKEVMGLVGIGIGLGEIVACFTYSLFSAKHKFNGFFTFLYVLTYITGFYILFLILPENSIKEETEDTAYVTAHASFLAIASGFLQGMADSFSYCQFTYVFCLVFQDTQNDSIYFSTQ
ncbi:UNC93-like protein MFSD11, partial [Convolutriloba macropyga]|uniref:UNC93-like protein MFSD11 n=1 Tax=Convolutriloba macropyga TaxID=536237 RepID=UPI003F5234A4